MTPQTAAKGLLALGANLIQTDTVRQASDAYHEALTEACDSTAELIGVAMIDALAVAASRTQTGQYGEVRDIIKAMVDEIFETSAEKFDSPQPEVLH